MWKHRIAYLILWVFALFLYIFYVGYISWFLFCFVSSLPIFSLLYLWIGKARLQIDLSVSQKQYEQGEKAILHVHTKTNQMLPIAPIQAELHIHNYFCDEDNQLPFWFASTNTMQAYSIDIELNTCGKYEIAISYLRVYDLLGLFSQKLKKTSKIAFYCLPKPLSCEFDLPEVEGEESSYDPFKRGYDTSETVGVHAYQPGDSLHAIHWKLSAKTDTYMVREFASQDHKKTAICFSFYGSLLEAQAILSYVYGGSLTLIKMGNVHEVKQYKEGQMILCRTISTRAELDQAMCIILEQHLHLGKQNEVPFATLASSLMVDAQGISSVKKGGVI